MLFLYRDFLRVPNRTGFLILVMDVDFFESPTVQRVDMPVRWMGGAAHPADTSTVHRAGFL